MIEEIRLRGLGVIDEAVLVPHSGFTAITGETGAGKTMVLTGLGLLLGARVDTAAVRQGADRADVEGRFSRVPSPVADRVRDAGGEVEDGELLLARSLATGSGRGRAVAGGRSTPVAVLGEIGAELVVVHGQRDHHRLLRPGAQRDLLDEYGGPSLLATRAAYQAAWAAHRAVQAELDEVRTHVRERLREADLLRAGLAEIEAAGPRPGEDIDLRTEADRLEHAESLGEAVRAAHDGLVGADGSDDPNALALLVAARRGLESAAAYDPSLTGPAGRLGELAALAADVAADLASYADRLDSDPARLSAVHDRRAALSALTRRYGQTVDEVLAWAQSSAARLLELDDDDERILRLTARVDELAAELARFGTELGAARRAVAGRLGDAVTAELAELAMPHARVQVRVDPLAEPGPYGLDEVELVLTPHRGAAALPLASAASGGELSRAMLALEVVLAGGTPVPTMVFDEVDAGVGGRAAIEVGRRLARLARSTQVLVVTHLSQVAAFADRQVVVTKTDDGTVTSTGLRVVEGDDRVRELARMLAGLEDSATAAAHADELLTLAAAERAPTRRKRKRSHDQGT